MPKTIGYKGFDNDFKCRDMQYEVGKTYEEPEARICECGLHFCTNPKDVFNYYPPRDFSRYALVETDSEVFGDTDDSKKCTTKLTIVIELTLSEMIQEIVKYSSTVASTGYRSTVASTGYRSTVSSTGDYSTVSSTGYRSTVSSTGYGSTVASTGYGFTVSSTGYGSTVFSTGYYSTVASTGNDSTVSSAGYGSTVSSTGNHSTVASTGNHSTVASTGENSLVYLSGMNSKAAGAIGTWITLVEWQLNKKKERYEVKTIKSFKIDGKEYKENTYYQLKNGEIVEATD